MLAASQPHPSQEWSGTSRPTMARYISANHTLSFLHTRFYTFQPLVSLRSLRDWGAGVGVWPSTSRPNKTEMARITPAQVWGTFVVAQSLGYLLFTFSPTQHKGPNKCDGRIYPGPFWPSTSRPKGMADGTCDYGVEVQRSSAQSQPKRKELIFGEVQTGKPKKERSWYLRSTYGKTPKKEGVDIWEVQTTKPQNGRSWSLRSTNGQTPKRKEMIFDKSTYGQNSEWKELIFNKDTEEQSQPIRKEPMRATSVGKWKNWSSNTNGPQIIIKGPLRN